MRSKASLRVCSQSLLKSEMLPPTMVCKLAPMVPTMERERTTIPRTTPRLRFTRKPGSSNAVVTNSCGTMSSPFCRTPFVGRTPPGADGAHDEARAHDDSPDDAEVALHAETGQFQCGGDEFMRYHVFSFLPYSLCGADPP